MSDIVVVRHSYIILLLVALIKDWVLFPPKSLNYQVVVRNSLIKPHYYFLTWPMWNLIKEMSNYLNWNTLDMLDPRYSSCGFIPKLFVTIPRVDEIFLNSGNEVAWVVQLLCRLIPRHLETKRVMLSPWSVYIVQGWNRKLCSSSVFLTRPNTEEKYSTRD